MRVLLRAIAFAIGLGLTALAPAGAAGRPQIANIAIPGDPAFVRISRDVLAIQTDYTPDFAAQSGLIDDAVRVPSFSPQHLAALHARLQGDLAGLHSLPWRRWDVDAQIDARWVYANAERMDRELMVERIFTHRPGAWLETVANDYIAILTYAPDRRDALAGVTQKIPAMVREMAALCHPTRADIATANGLIDGITAMLRANSIAGGDAAIASLNAYKAQISALTGVAPYAVIGAENYAWRLQRAELLPWTPKMLVSLAQDELARVDAQLAALAPQLPKAGPLSAELAADAAALTQASLLADYDAIQVANRAEIERAGFLTIPPGVGPIRARVTPDAMVPLTGDGGSMNPPPPFIDTNVGLWNVEHFNPAMTAAEREKTIREAKLFRENRMGPYAAHEGFPGHHLQLGIARLNRDPIRNLLPDPVQNEGWALYAEQLLWENGGLGPSVAAHVATLKSWRFRIRRVVYDVNIETGAWTVQQGADWKTSAAPGQGKPDEDLLRSINWPAQLICYFAGKEQILALKADYKRKAGPAYSERNFNDELLALGSVPYVFARAKMLGEPVPDM
ncbi:MAG: hypothetical protein NVS3B28_27090 [Candidatus Velthaea sp.]